MLKRHNPHKLFKRDDLLSMDREEMLRISELVSIVSDQVWSDYTSEFEREQDLDELLEAAQNGDDVYIGVSFVDDGHHELGRVLSYIIAYELPSDLDSMRNDPDTMESLDAVGLTPEAAVKILNGRKVLYVADYSRLRTEEAKLENAALFNSVLAFAMEGNFVVSARCRKGTSYKVLKRYADKGYITFLFDFATDSAEYRHVVIEISQSSRAVRFFRKYLLWANVAKEIGRKFIARAIRGGLSRIRNRRRRIGRDR
jgi:hypothetical protein